MYTVYWTNAEKCQNKCSSNGGAPVAKQQTVVALKFLTYRFNSY